LPEGVAVDRREGACDLGPGAIERAIPGTSAKYSDAAKRRSAELPGSSVAAASRRRRVVETLAELEGAPRPIPSGALDFSMRPDSAAALRARPAARPAQPTFADVARMW
jgi:hypothetical protein